MKTTSYQTDITEAELDAIKSCLHIRRASKWPLIQIINAILYVCGEGIKWRALPTDFSLPWETVYWYFAKWRDGGSWAAINEMLVMMRRQRCEGTVLPSVLVIDSQTVKNTATSTIGVGVDGGKKMKGRKRLQVTDSQGNLLYVTVFAANHHDGARAAKWWTQTLRSIELLSEVVRIKADHHFGGVFKKTVEQERRVCMEVSTTPVERPSQTVMTVHKGRWVVERTFAWLNNSRRLSKDYERLPESAEAFCYISSIARLLKHTSCPN